MLPPRGVQNYIFLSEVATLEFLSQTSVPSPRVYHYQLDAPENPVGSLYVLMEKMPGTPLDWNSAGPEQPVRVMEQLADVYLELERHPLQMAGSIVPSDTPGTVGGFAQEPWFETQEKPLGPFTTLQAAYEAVLRQQLQTIRHQEITSLPVENYLAFLWRFRTLPNLVSSSVSSNGPFYLKHYEDKGDHILVDESHNITAIIDWEFASAEAKELAFSSPCMMWPVGKYYDGSNELSEDEVAFAQIFAKRGRKDLYETVLKGRRWQRFAFFLGGGVPHERVEFEALFKGLRQSWASVGGGKCTLV